MIYNVSTHNQTPPNNPTLKTRAKEFGKGKDQNLLPPGSDDMGVFGVGDFPVAILRPFDMCKVMHYNCIGI